MRLIDADDIKYQLLKPNTNPTLWCVSKDAVDLMPTVDAVHVVRCKDCKYGEIDNPDFPDRYLCHFSGFNWNNGEHFCADGEKDEVNE